MKTLARRAWHSPTLMTWASLGIRLSGLVVVLPVVLHRFPVAEVAVWQLFSTIFTLMLLLDLGLSPTFSRLFAYARGGASIAEMGDMRTRSPSTGAAAVDPAIVLSTGQKLLAALRWVYPKLAAFVLVVFAIGGTVALEKPVAQCVEPMRIWFAWGVVLVGGFVSMLGNAYAAALQGMNEVAAQRRNEMFSGAGQVATSLLVVAFGGDVLALVLSYQAWAIVNAWRNRALLLRLHPHMADLPATRDRVVMRILWPPTWRSGIGVLMSQGVIQASGLVFGQLAPAGELAAYLLAIRIVTTISQISQAPFYSKLPHLASLQASGERAQQLALSQQGMRRAQWVLVAGLVFVAFMANPLLHAIRSHTPFVDRNVWFMICLAFFVERYGAMHMQLYSLTNHIVWHIANGVTGAVMIAAAVLLYPWIGEIALPASMLLAYAGVYSAYSLWLSSRAFEFSPWRFEMRASLPPLVTLVACLLVRSAWH